MSSLRRSKNVNDQVERFGELMSAVQSLPTALAPVVSSKNSAVGGPGGGYNISSGVGKVLGAPLPVQRVRPSSAMLTSSTHGNHGKYTRPSSVAGVNRGATNTISVSPLPMRSNLGLSRAVSSGATAAVASTPQGESALLDRVMARHRDRSVVAESEVGLSLATDGTNHSFTENVTEGLLIPGKSPADVPAYRLEKYAAMITATMDIGGAAEAVTTANRVLDAKATVANHLHRFEMNQLKRRTIAADLEEEAVRAQEAVSIIAVDGKLRSGEMEVEGDLMERSEYSVIMHAKGLGTALGRLGNVGQGLGSIVTQMRDVTACAAAVRGGKKSIATATTLSFPSGLKDAGVIGVDDSDANNNINENNQILSNLTTADGDGAVSHSSAQLQALQMAHLANVEEKLAARTKALVDALRVISSLSARYRHEQNRSEVGCRKASQELAKLRLYTKALEGGAGFTAGWDWRRGAAGANSGLFGEDDDLDTRLRGVLGGAAFNDLTTGSKAPNGSPIRGAAADGSISNNDNLSSGFVTRSSSMYVSPHRAALGDRLLSGGGVAADHDKEDFFLPLDATVLGSSSFGGTLMSPALTSRRRSLSNMSFRNNTTGGPPSSADGGASTGGGFSPNSARGGGANANPSAEAMKAMRQELEYSENELKFARSEMDRLKQQCAQSERNLSAKEEEMSNFRAATEAKLSRMSAALADADGVGASAEAQKRINAALQTELDGLRKGYDALVVATAKLGESGEGSGRGGDGKKGISEEARAVISTLEEKLTSTRAECQATSRKVLAYEKALHQQSSAIASGAYGVLGVLSRIQSLASAGTGGASSASSPIVPGSGASLDLQRLHHTTQNRAFEAASDGARDILKLLEMSLSLMTPQGHSTGTTIPVAIVPLQALEAAAEQGRDIADRPKPQHLLVGPPSSGAPVGVSSTMVGEFDRGIAEMERLNAVRRKVLMDNLSEGGGGMMMMMGSRPSSANNAGAVDGPVNGGRRGSGPTGIYVAPIGVEAWRTDLAYMESLVLRMVRMTGKYQHSSSPPQIAKSPNSRPKGSSEGAVARTSSGGGGGSSDSPLKSSSSAPSTKKRSSSAADRLFAPTASSSQRTAKKEPASPTVASTKKTKKPSASSPSDGGKGPIYSDSTPVSSALLSMAQSAEVLVKMAAEPLREYEALRRRRGTRRSMVQDSLAASRGDDSDSSDSAGPSASSTGLMVTMENGVQFKMEDVLRVVLEESRREAVKLHFRRIRRRISDRLTLNRQASSVLSQVISCRGKVDAASGIPQSYFTAAIGSVVMEQSAALPTVRKSVRINEEGNTSTPTASSDASSSPAPGILRRSVSGRLLTQQRGASTSALGSTLPAVPASSPPPNVGTHAWAAAEATAAIEATRASVRALLRSYQKAYPPVLAQGGATLQQRAVTEAKVPSSRGSKRSEAASTRKSPPSPNTNDSPRSATELISDQLKTDRSAWCLASIAQHLAQSRQRQEQEQRLHLDPAGEVVHPLSSGGMNDEEFALMRLYSGRLALLKALVPLAARLQKERAERRVQRRMTAGPRSNSPQSNAGEGSVLFPLSATMTSATSSAVGGGPVYFEDDGGGDGSSSFMFSSSEGVLARRAGQDRRSRGEGDDDVVNGSSSSSIVLFSGKPSNDNSPREGGAKAICDGLPVLDAGVGVDEEDPLLSTATLVRSAVEGAVQSSSADAAAGGPPPLPRFADGSGSDTAALISAVDAVREQFRDGIARYTRNLRSLQRGVRLSEVLHSGGGGGECTPPPSSSSVTSLDPFSRALLASSARVIAADVATATKGYAQKFHPEGAQHGGQGQGAKRQQQGAGARRRLLGSSVNGARSSNVVAVYVSKATQTSAAAAGGPAKHRRTTSGGATQALASPRVTFSTGTREDIGDGVGGEEGAATGSQLAEEEALQRATALIESWFQNDTDDGFGLGLGSAGVGTYASQWDGSTVADTEEHLAMLLGSDVPLGSARNNNPNSRGGARREAANESSNSNTPAFYGAQAGQPIAPPSYSADAERKYLAERVRRLEDQLRTTKLKMSEYLKELFTQKFFTPSGGGGASRRHAPRPTVHVVVSEPAKFHLTRELDLPKQINVGALRTGVVVVHDGLNDDGGVANVVDSASAAFLGATGVTPTRLVQQQRRLSVQHAAATPPPSSNASMQASHHHVVEYPEMATPDDFSPPSSSSASGNNSRIVLGGAVHRPLSAQSQRSAARRGNAGSGLPLGSSAQSRGASHQQQRRPLSGAAVGLRQHLSAHHRRQSSPVKDKGIGVDMEEELRAAGAMSPLHQAGDDGLAQRVEHRLSLDEEVQS